MRCTRPARPPDGHATRLQRYRPDVSLGKGVSKGGRFRVAARRGRGRVRSTGVRSKNPPNPSKTCPYFAPPERLRGDETGMIGAGSSTGGMLKGGRAVVSHPTHV